MGVKFSDYKSDEFKFYSSLQNESIPFQNIDDNFNLVVNGINDCQIKH